MRALRRFRRQCEELLLGQAGFSMVQTLVAAGIGGVVILAMTNLLTSQQELNTLMEDKLSRFDLQRELQQRFLDPAVCQATLNGVLVSATPQNVIISDATPTVLYNPADASKNRFGQLRIASIQLVDVSVGGPNATGRVELRVGLDRTRDGPPLLRNTLPFRFTVTTDGASNVSECAGVGGPASVEGPAWCSEAPVTVSYMIGSSYKLCMIGAYANDTDGQWATCRVEKVGADWVLFATCAPDSAVNCRANCF